MEQEVKTTAQNKVSPPKSHYTEKMKSDVFFHHISDMIFIMEVEPGPKFRYFFVNKMGLEHASMNEGHFGQLFEDVLPPERFAHLYPYYKRAVFSSEPVVYIDEVTSDSKAANIYESRLSAVKDESGNVEYVICVTRDLHWSNAETIKYLELHDQLTGAWNRRALMEHLQFEIAAALPTDREFAVVNLDLDRFKQFNDTLGHDAGDDLLKFLTARLFKWNKPGQRIYRLGSDEFVILMSDSNREGAENSVQELLTLFDQPFEIQDEEYYMTPSVGVSMFPLDGRDSDTLLKNAHNALFLVKEQGRGHYRFYRSSMEDSFSNYVLMEAHLRKAIEKGEFKLHYQPQVNLKTGNIQSFEALLRWNNGKFGAVSPAQFIPLAEETGLIIPIGEWVIKTACMQLAAWRSKGYDNIRVAINISPRQFMERDLPDIIKKTLETYNLPASSLEIEITEGAMQDTSAALHMLNRLKEMGVVLSVDDFGTGYSSLNYLKNFPIDILKIDQSFVREIKKNNKDAAITKTIIHLAHSLGLEVVAEGVEEEVQVDFLTEANCQKAQGFYFSKPVNATEIEKEILSQKY